MLVKEVKVEVNFLLVTDFPVILLPVTKRLPHLNDFVLVQLIRIFPFRAVPSCH